MSVLALLAGSAKSKSGGDGESSGPRVERDSFLFMTPRTEGEHADFAQCASCRMFVPEEALDGKMKESRCIAHGSKVSIDEDDSCGLYLPWPTEDGSPVEAVVHDHAGEILKGIPGSVTPKESGLVSRRVQCHRCRFAARGNKICHLYEALNETFPKVFKLDVKITPNSCCNAQEPKPGAKSEDDD